MSENNNKKNTIGGRHPSGRPRPKRPSNASALNSTSYILIAIIVLLVGGGAYMVTSSSNANGTGGSGINDQNSTSTSEVSDSSQYVGTPGLATGKPADDKLASAGKKLYDKLCVACHGVNGVGEIPEDMYALDKNGLVVAPPLDGSAHAWHHPDEDLLDVILNGSPRNPRMIAWKNTVSIEEGVALINYMKSLWAPNVLNCQGDGHMSPECQALSNTK